MNTATVANHIAKVPSDIKWPSVNKQPDHEINDNSNPETLIPIVVPSGPHNIGVIDTSIHKGSIGPINVDIASSTDISPIPDVTPATVPMTTVTPATSTVSSDKKNGDGDGGDGGDDFSKKTEVNIFVNPIGNSTVVKVSTSECKLQIELHRLLLF